MDPAGTDAYRSLNPSKQEFRLLTLLASPDFSATLQAELQVVEIGSSPQYEALSYVWGTAEFEHELYIEHRRYPITENLDYALRYLRHRDKNRVLWVDALCINQRNTIERNDQVTMMRDIYQNCSAAIAWLGPLQKLDEDEMECIEWASKCGLYEGVTEETLRHGFDLFKEIQNRDIATLQVMEERWQSGNLDEGEYFLGPSPTTTVQSSPIYLMRKRQRLLLEAVFLQPELWSRIWIVQELACASKVILTGGRYTLDWALVSSFLADGSYADAFHSPFGHGHVTPAIERIFSNAKRIEQQRKLMRRSQPGNHELTLFDVLARFRGQSSTDPRDKIYGILGLVAEEHALKVQYQKTEAEVFAAATAELIRLRQDFDILCQNPWELSAVDLSSHRRLASWVVDFANDFSVFDENDNGNREFMFAQRQIFSASSSTCDGRWQVLDSVILHIHGYILDEIHAIRQQDPYQIRQVDRRGLLYWKGGLNEEDIYEATGETIFQALWRTWVTDCKAYPISRLDGEDIAHDSIVFQQLLGQPGLDDGAWDKAFEKLRSKTMWTRNKKNWSFFTSQSGLFILARQHVMDGDVVAVVEGGKVPFILRPVGRRSNRENCFEFVSPAYVHGYMDGEAAVGGVKGTLHLREILLV
ncbi:Heterokaryon incompatibility protein (HET) domain containing protein [Hyaloscypha variabilis]